MHPNTRAKLRQDIASNGDLTSVDIAKLSKMAAAVDALNPIFAGDIGAAPPEQTFILQSLRKVHLLDDMWKDGSTFCRRRNGEPADVYYEVPWDEAKKLVTCPGCIAYGISGREIPEPAID